MPDTRVPIDAAGVDAPGMAVGPEVLVTNEKRPSSIALHDGTVLWTTDPPANLGKGDVVYLSPDNTFGVLAIEEEHPNALALAQSAGGPIALWSVLVGFGKMKQVLVFESVAPTTIDVGDYVYSIAADGDAIFFGTRFRVYKKGLATTATPVEIAGVFGNGVSAITADASGVVFAARQSQGGWIIGAMSRDGGTVTTIGTAPEAATPIRGVTIVGSDVYWLDRTMLKKVPRTGGTTATVHTFGSSDRPTAMARSGAKLFLATSQAVIAPTGATGRIVELDTVTGTMRELATEQAEPSGIAVDATHVYWVNRGLGAADGQVMRIAR